TSETGVFTFKLTSTNLSIFFLNLSSDQSCQRTESTCSIKTENKSIICVVCTINLCLLFSFGS
uniref:Uncharacterized protein n=1 Tax=Athene cunicularia TaxID=194338 RepID=A0A663LW46_ATHCN